MKVSIIVPIYNLENEINVCVSSIVSQTYQDIEIILVDDGSTDGSKAAIEKWAHIDKRIIPVFKENGGVTSARLAGIKQSSGDWIGFVDGDDWIEPDMIQILMNNAELYDADISHCGFEIDFTDGRVRYFYNTGRLVQQDKITGLKDLLSGEFIEPGLWNKLFHKTLFHSLLHNEVMDYSIKNNEDLLMNYYLFKESKKSVYQDICPYHYIARQSSASRAKLSINRLLDPIKVRKIIVDDAEEALVQICSANYVCSCIDAYNTLLRDGDHSQILEARIIKQKLMESQNLLLKLKTRQKYVGYAILYFEKIYRVIYRLYAKTIMKNPFSNKK